MSASDAPNPPEQQSAVAEPLPALPAPSLIRGQLRNIPFRLAASVPLNGLKLRNLRELRQGQLLVTDISAAEDVPMYVGGALLGYAELDNVDGQMAVRLTRLT